jgi:hypothetical protein
MKRVDSLGELIRLALDGRLSDVHTAIPGSVIAYVPATQKAIVQPVINRPVETEDDPLFSHIFEVQPTLQDIPICFPRGGGYSITWPLIPGDSVLVVFSEADIAQWIVTGSLSNPDQLRRHGLFGGFALPCVGPDTAPLAAAVDPGLVVTGASIKLGSLAATDFVALSSLVQTALNTITAAFDAHTHSGVSTGTGSTGTPAAPIGTVGPVAAIKVKAE